MHASLISLGLHKFNMYNKKPANTVVKVQLNFPVWLSYVHIISLHEVAKNSGWGKTVFAPVTHFDFFLKKSRTLRLIKNVEIRFPFQFLPI